MTNITDKRIIWWGSFLVILSALVTILSMVRGCSLMPTKTIVIEEGAEPIPVVRCGDANAGDVRQLECPDGQDGKVFEVCRDGDWQPTVDTCREPTGEPVDDCGTVFADVQPILTESCLGCHFFPDKFDDYSVAYGKFDTYMEVIQLPSDNPNRMPKDPNNPLSREQIELLQDWGDNGKKEDCESSEPVGGELGHLNLDDIENVILRDLSSLEEDDRKNSRYLVTSHKRNLGDPEGKLRIFEQAINKNLNHLNSGGVQGQIHKAQEISPTIFRFDLRSFNMDTNDWILIEDSDHLDLESFTDKGLTIKFLSQSRKSWLHFDTFIDVVGKARVYYSILHVSHTLHEYLEHVGVDVHQQLADLEPFFLGSNGSEISLQKNRLIVRYEGNDDFPFTWVTYDPISPNGVANRNLFFAPLLHGTGGTGDRNFDFAASETITQTQTGFISNIGEQAV